MSVMHRKEPQGNAAGVEEIKRQLDDLKEQTGTKTTELQNQLNDLKEQTGTGTTELKKQLEEMKAAADKAAAFSSENFQMQIITDRATNLNLITDSQILQAGELAAFPEYQDAHEYKHKGEIITYNGRTYEVIAPHTSNLVAYPPETTFAYYRLIELKHTGTLADPIPYPKTPGILVNVKNGLYYSYKGSIYKAKLDMPNCVYPPDTPGMWQWEKVEG